MSKNSVLSMSEKDYNAILALVAKELSIRNNSDSDLEFHELSKIDRYTVDINITATITYAYIQNLSFDDNDKRMFENKSIDDCINYILDINNYNAGSKEERDFFINEWIKIFSVSRVSYSIEIMKKIKKLRLEKGLSQKEVANFLNISSQAYGHYENGKREPDLDTLIKLAHLFDVTLDFLVNIHYSQVLGADFQLHESQPMAMKSFSQSIANFVCKLQQLDIPDEKFSQLTNEQIEIIAAIIKKNI